MNATVVASDRRPLLLRWALASTVVVLLVIAIALVTRLASHVDRIERTADSPGSALVDEIRTLQLIERDTLRLTTDLHTDPGANAALLVDAIDRRLEDAIEAGSLLHPSDTLYHDDLLALHTSWHDEIAPIIEALPDEPDRFDAVVHLLRDFEAQTDDLLQDAEGVRIRQALEERNELLTLARTTRGTLVGAIAVALGLLTALTIAAVLFRRHDRDRANSDTDLRELTDESRMLSLVASRSHNLAIVTDRDGRIEWVNDAFVRTSGYTLDEVRGQVATSLLHGPGTDVAADHLIRRRIRAGQPYHVEALNYARDGSTYWVEIDAQPIRNERDEITHFLAVAADITDQKLTADHLRRTRDAAEELARAKSMFLANMSHEIRTPLNAMLGLTELLLETDLDDQQREFATTAHNSGQLLLDILNNILDFSALEAGRVEVDLSPFEPGALVERVADSLQPMADRRGVELHTTVDDEVPAWLSGDPVRLQQILVNLVSNGIKFTEQGSVSVTARWTAPNLEIEVTDTGIGIAAEQVGQLFQPFSQADASISRRFGGSGLGLAISRHLADVLGGSLTLDSIEGVGTTVRVVAPMTVGAPRSLPAAGPEPRHSSSDLRILVAEDDAVNRRVAEHMLARLGHEAEFVVDGEQAISACLERPFDLVLMDVQMPECDGITATAEIRRQLGDAPQPVIIALTANALAGDRERFIEAGMDGYLSKPVGLQRLAEMIDLHTRGSSAPPADAADSPTP